MPDTFTYEAWAGALRAHFFDEANAGVPVTFFVDGDVLADVLGIADPHAAEARLATAVRPRLLPESSGDVFHRVIDESWTWKLKHPDSDPPFLPVLAVAVLAAANMAATADWAANNYYEPLRKILGLHTGKGMPRGYDAAMQSLWGHLAWWLNVHMKGQLGLSAVPARPTPPYIGYALSQALFRTSDRQRLTHFFSALDLHPGEPIETPELLTYFRAWSQRSPLSSGAREMAQREEYTGTLSAILAAEWRRWDGLLRDDHGRRLGQILITLDLYLRPRLALVAERPRGFPAPAGFDFGESGGTIVLEAASSDYYQTLPLDVTPLALATGLRGIHDGLALALLPGPIIPFRPHEALGCWASARQLVPGAQHWVLVRADHADLVREYLLESAMTGWREASGIAPAEWTFFRDVVVDAAPPASISPALSRIIPSLRERPAFWGGLALSSNPALYLAGGEPDLWVPTQQTGATVAITIDGRPSLTGSSGGRFALRSCGLEPGHHEIRVGPSRLTFQTADTLGAVNPRSAVALGHSLSLTEDGYRPTSGSGASERHGELPQGVVQVVGISLVGANPDLPARGRAPLLLPAKAAEYVLLGATPGQIVRPRIPFDAPRWVDKIAPYSAGREFTPSFDVVWVLVARHIGGWEARACNRLHPDLCDEFSSDVDSVRDWCRVLLEVSPRVADDALLLWIQYQECAEAVSI